MIDWYLAPEGADSIKQNPAKVLRWFKGNLKYVDGVFADGFSNNAEWKTLATRPTQKTVADAVEWAKGKWKHDCYVGIGYGEGSFVYYQDNSLIDKGISVAYEIVCTREKFEAYVKEQESSQQSSLEEEQWTHIYCGGKCKLLEPNKDADGYYAIKTWTGLFELAKSAELKPIKPKLSTKEYTLLAQYSSHLNVNPSEFDQYISETYEVIDD